MDQAAERGVPGDRANNSATHRERQTAKQRPNRGAGEKERGRGDEQEHVLDHVDAEQVEGDRIDRRREGRDERPEAEEEQRRPPPWPLAARASAAEVDDGRKDGEDED
jgi:hypothetical protein